MGRELQKRKRRSSRATVRTHTRSKKVLNPQGNGVIATNWDKKETLSQNYSRFGIVARLGKTAGGVQKKIPGSGDSAAAKPAPLTNPLAHKPLDRGLLQVREVKVERDASGRIVRVVREANPLHDPLNEVEDGSDIEDDGKEWGGIDADAPEVLKALEAQMNVSVQARVRHQSEREREWLEDLVKRHGEDVEAMMRDRKLNPMQQTAADIRKRLKKAGLLS
ncbi:ribosome biogenesis protein Nop16 [Podospora aff. communis PSN243]|uniref:Nucleolar protein 16 n=1 Tax=Podospora aff. communis PSN243 TaxID=3040156 RepID=A0AAV9H0R7_9PEZI|nr:ribosome biogenesis protein Nop16 [Podospora aff. communis PSN243]